MFDLGFCSVAPISGYGGRTATGKRALRSSLTEVHVSVLIFQVCVRLRFCKMHSDVGLNGFRAASCLMFGKLILRPRAEY